MTLDEEDEEQAVKVFEKMAKKNVTGSHHKQSQTISGWFVVDEQGSVKQTLDEMAKEPCGVSTI